MDTTASSFTLRKNAKRAAEAMIRKGTAPAADYDINPSGDGRFEIVWKSAKIAPTTDDVETEIAEASADQPAAASPTEDASQPVPAATEPASALSKPASKNEWPHGTRVMVRKGKSWREATIINRLDPDHWRAEYPAAAPPCSGKPISELTTRSAMRRPPSSPGVPRRSKSRRGRDTPLTPRRYRRHRLSLIDRSEHCSPYRRVVERRIAVVEGHDAVRRREVRHDRDVGVAADLVDEIARRVLPPIDLAAAQSRRCRKWIQR